MANERIYNIPDLQFCDHLKDCRHPHDYHHLDEDTWVCLVCRPMIQQEHWPKRGLYRHYKRDLYIVLGVAANSENREEKSVVYWSLAKECFWYRPLSMFLEFVELEDSHGKYRTRRFSRIGDAL